MLELNFRGGVKRLVEYLRKSELEKATKKLEEAGRGHDREHAKKIRKSATMHRDHQSSSTHLKVAMKSNLYMVVTET